MKRKEGKYNAIYITFCKDNLFIAGRGGVGEAGTRVGASPGKLKGRANFKLLTELPSSYYNTSAEEHMGVINESVITV